MRLQFVASGSVVVLAIGSLCLVTGCGASRPATAGAASPAHVGSGTTTVHAGSQPGALATGGTVMISEEIRRACGIADDDAYFSFDSSAIQSVDLTPLDAVARCFTVGPLSGHSLRLIGHADPRGASEYNLTLGQSRADSVEGYLDRHGVTRSHIATTSRGAIDATGVDESGWAHDRRVDVMLGS